MEPDSSSQQIPDMLEREEMASTTSSEPQLQPPQSAPKKLILRPRSSKPDKVSHPPPWEEDLQPEDSCSPAKKAGNNKNVPRQYINNGLTPEKFYQIDSVKENLLTFSCLTTRLGYRPSTSDLQSFRWRAFSSIPIQVYPNVMSSSRLLHLLFCGQPDIFEKETARTDLFSKIIPHLTFNQSSIDKMCPDEVMKSVLAYYRDEHQTEEKQYAFAVAYLKNDDLIFLPAVYPSHSKGGGRSPVPTKKHSEEELTQQIEDILPDCGNEVQILLVYSYNSPCLKRKNNATCCMDLLLQKAAQWGNMYGFFTIVSFTKLYGPAGRFYFQYLTYSDISDPGSVFFPYIEKCEDIPFKLVSNRKEHELRRKLMKISEKRTIYDTIDLGEAAHKEKLRSSIKSILHDLVNQANSSCHKKDHLDRGTKIIMSSEFPLEVKNEIVTTIINNWKEIVNNESMSLIREKITTDFNNAVVQLFVKELKCFGGDSSPLKLYQVSQNMEGEGEYVQHIRERFNLN